MTVEPGDDLLASSAPGAWRNGIAIFFALAALTLGVAAILRSCRRRRARELRRTEALDAG